MSIATTYLRDVLSQDHHSAIIKQNREGIKRGAMFKRRMSIITEDEESEIISLVNHADLSFFMPILYIIPYEDVRDICNPVDNSKKASIHSIEFIIEELPRERFEIVDLGKTVPIEVGGDIK